MPAKQGRNVLLESRLAPEVFVARFSLRVVFLTVGFVAPVTATLLYSSLIPLLATTVCTSVLIAAIQAALNGAARLPFATGYAITGIAFLAILNSNPEWGDFDPLRKK